MSVTVPAVGDPIKASWGVSVAGAINQPILGESQAGAAVTLATTSAFASTCSVTFTLTVQTRIRIDVQGQFTLATAVAGRYDIRGGYNSGASPAIGSFVGVGQSNFNVSSVVGLLGANSAGTVLLAAGTYTAYASVQRFSGGAATDTVGNFEVLVTQEGFV